MEIVSLCAVQCGWYQPSFECHQRVDQFWSHFWGWPVLSSKPQLIWSQWAVWGRGAGQCHIKCYSKRCHANYSFYNIRWLSFVNQIFWGGFVYFVTARSCTMLLANCNGSGQMKNVGGTAESKFKFEHTMFCVLAGSCLAVFCPIRATWNGRHAQ